MKKIFTFLFSTLSMATFAQNLQGGLESWQNYNAGSQQLEKPAGWVGSDSLVFTLGPILAPGGSFVQQLFKSGDSHSGSFAARLISREQDILGVMPCVLSNATIIVDIIAGTFETKGGTPVSARIDSVKGWVKYFPRGGDEGTLNVQAVILGAGAGGADSIVGIGTALISSSGTYQQIAAQVVYNDPNVVPNALQVGFASGSFTAATDSTELYVDDVSAVTATGIAIPLFTGETISCYPNPATEIVYLQSSLNEPLTWNLYTTCGQILSSRTFEYESTVDLSAIASGIYFYEVQNKNGELLQTAKLIIQ